MPALRALGPKMSGSETLQASIILANAFYDKSPMHQNRRPGDSLWRVAERLSGAEQQGIGGHARGPPGAHHFRQLVDVRIHAHSPCAEQNNPQVVSWGRNIYLGAIVSSPVRCGFFVSIITSFYPLFKTPRDPGYIPVPSVNAAQSVIASDRRERSNLPTWPNEIASSRTHSLRSVHGLS